MSHFVVKCPAKINLALKINGKREDGYHLLSMVNLPLELHDVIDVEEVPFGMNTHVVCDDMHLLGLRFNLCFRAVEALREKCGFGNNFMIHIHKEIPSAAGLGGGSSDAAGILLSLNNYLKLGLSRDDLCELALPLGSDIPFFIIGKPALAEGIGGKIIPITPKKKYFCLLIKPEKGLSTKDVYAKFEQDKALKIDIPNVIKGVESGDDDLIVSSFGNDLYIPSSAMLPEVKDIVDELRKEFPLSAMSGSGSCCFALSTDLKKIKAAEKVWIKKGYDPILTSTLI